MSVGKSTVVNISEFVDLLVTVWPESQVEREHDEPERWVGKLQTDGESFSVMLQRTRNWAIVESASLSVSRCVSDIISELFDYKPFCSYIDDLHGKKSKFEWEKFDPHQRMAKIIERRGISGLRMSKESFAKAPDLPDGMDALFVSYESFVSSIPHHVSQYNLAGVLEFLDSEVFICQSGEGVSFFEWSDTDPADRHAVEFAIHPLYAAGIIRDEDVESIYKTFSLGMDCLNWGEMNLLRRFSVNGSDFVIMVVNEAGLIRLCLKSC